MLAFLPFCLHPYCLFPFFYLLLAFQLRGLRSISPKLSLATAPACLGPPAPSLQSLSQPSSVLLAAQLWLTPADGAITGRKVTAACDTHTANPILLEGCQLQSQSEQEGCYGISCAASPAPLPPPSPSSPALAQGAAPLCQRGTSQHQPGSRGNYSRRSGNTHVKPTRAPEPRAAPLCPLRAGWWEFSCARLRVQEQGSDRRPGYGPSSVTHFVRPGKTSHTTA